MIAGIKEWTQGIVVAVIIATILEMLLPNNKNKKYINTVIGIYILFSVIAPVISKVAGKEIDIKDYINNDIYVATNYTMKNVKLLENSSNVEDIYIKTLKQDITNKLKIKGYKVENIDLNIDTNSENTYGEIIGMNLHISLKDEKNINKVDEIKIEVSNNSTQKSNISNISEGQLNEIKEFLMDEYGIEKSKIHINN